MTHGLLYTIFKDEEKPHLEECYKQNLLMSVTSLRKFSNLPVTIITDYDDLNLRLNNLSIKKTSFESYRAKDLSKGHHSHIRKLETLKNLPYDMTIFSDVDILFLDNPEKVIDQKFDLSIARETCFIKGCAKLCNMLNTGFFVAKNEFRFANLVEKARDILHNRDSYPEIPKHVGLQGDQYYIDCALDYIFDIDIRILPPQWNVRKPVINEVKNPKIIHCKDVDFKQAYC